jgi:hypothetical protein
MGTVFTFQPWKLQYLLLRLSSGVMLVILFAKNLIENLIQDMVAGVTLILILIHILVN